MKKFGMGKSFAISSIVPQSSYGVVLMYYLNLGSGQHVHPAWINIADSTTADSALAAGVIVQDWRQGIPLGDNSVDAIYHSQGLAHLSLEEVTRVLQECFRVLRIEGILRVTVPFGPDAAESAPASDHQPDRPPNPTLEALLQQQGFRQITACSAHESQIRHFHHYHLDVLASGQVRQPDAHFFEALKPAPGSDRWQISVPTAAPQVIHISTFDTKGGAARAAYNIHQGLVQIGQPSRMLVNYKFSQDATVASARSQEGIRPIAQDAVLAEIQAHYVEPHRSTLTNTLFDTWTPGLDLSGIAAVQTADILHLHWISFFQSPQALAGLLALDKPVIWTLQDMWAMTGGCHYSAGCDRYQAAGCYDCPQLEADPYQLPAAFLRLKHQILAQRDLTIVAPSQWLADCARRSQLFQHHRIEIIPSTTDTDRFAPLPKPEAKAKFGWSPAMRTILFGCETAAERRKGFPELLAAMQHCLQRPAVQELVAQEQLTILCFGHASESLSDLHLPIHNLGHVSDDRRLQEYYSAADVCVVPSLEDNFPNIVLEAMGCGTPVVAFRAGGIPDMVQNGQTGLLVPTGDVVQLAEAIGDCILDPDRCASLGQAARDAAVQNFALAVQAQHYQQLYHDIHQATLRPSGSAPPPKNTDWPLANHRPLAVPEDIAATLEAVGAIATQRSLHQERAISQEWEQRLQLAHDRHSQQQAIAAQTLDQVQAQLVNTQTQIQKTQQALLQAQQEREAAQHEQQRLQTVIAAMETSKFWQLRTLWFKLRRLIQLGAIE
jgi:glycosyltransferase involved in cell wall biosynthesis